MGKSCMMADIDHLDIVPRAETLNTVPGQPVMLQLGCVPAYALTVRYSAPLCDTRAAPLSFSPHLWLPCQVHKTQALSIKHVVRGCLQGVFAQVRPFFGISPNLCWCAEHLVIKQKRLPRDKSTS
jgi:hypothetical protein